MSAANIMKEISLRRATVADAQAIAAVRIESWRATYRGIMPDDYLDEMKLDDSTAIWEKVLSAGNDAICVFVAIADNEIIGFASGMLLKEEKQGMHAELTAIYLRTAFQNSGIGQRMLQKVARTLQAMGASNMLVWVLTGNKAARQFYENFGGQFLVEQDFIWDELELQEVAYGWPDLNELTQLHLSTAEAAPTLH
ncbi:GNAT family N-acetyltransferase [Undibacterium sp. Jales W-56]|uniref:GNAT family N-acetyltransferase n=1 Tax=Undibacterium sp. Jales W-56 TaxID=2897325 RepID=UPI0021D22E7B|nr:GNAT family N-acetyltransferase [Undibacterium sp. Jales W-56]MCU6433005.1 GNAT family N-acetyltransferase [Undibacterium sp. Jales W-56]